MGKTPRSHVIHSLGGEYCWIVRDSKPIRLLESPRSLSGYILMSHVWCPTSDVQNPMFDVQCPLSDAWCPTSDALSNSDVRCPISMCDVRCLMSGQRTRQKNGQRSKQEIGKKNGQKKGQEIDKNSDEKSDKRSDKKEEKRSDKKMGRENRTLHCRLGIRILSSSAESISHEWAKRTSERYFQREKRKFVSPSGHEMFLLFYRYWWNSYIKHNCFFFFIFETAKYCN